MRTATTGHSFLSVLLLILLLSCASPFLERAHDPPGFSGGIGVTAVESVELGATDFDETHEHLTIMPVASARYCLDNGMAFSLQAGYGYMRGQGGVHAPQDSAGIRRGTALVGAKLPIGQRGAVKGTLGVLGSIPWDRHSYLPVGSLSYLHDLGDLWTVSASIGFPVVIGLGVSIHPRIGEHVVTHIALGTSTILSAGLGLGVDFVGSDQTKD